MIFFCTSSLVNFVINFVIFYNFFWGGRGVAYLHSSKLFQQLHKLERTQNMESWSSGPLKKLLVYIYSVLVVEVGSY